MQRNGLGAVDRLAQDRVAGSPEGANALVVSGAVPAVTVSAAATVLNSSKKIQNQQLYRFGCTKRGYLGCTGIYEPHALKTPTKHSLGPKRPKASPIPKLTFLIPLFHKSRNETVGF